MVSFILATLGTRQEELERLFDSFESQTDEKFELVIVSQDNREVIDKLLVNRMFKYKHIVTNKKGLSRARNIGLKYISGDIVGFADDDCWYESDVVEFLNKVMKQRDVLTVQHKDKEKNEYPKKYPKYPKNGLSKIDILRQASIDIFVSSDIIKKCNVEFDEIFGLGATYPSGEENIFLMDLRNKGYRIDYYPKVLSYHPNKASNTEKLDEKMLISKGPLFKRLFGGFGGKMMYFAFILKKQSRITRPMFTLISGLNQAKRMYDI